jgi:hypothetical protein
MDDLTHVHYFILVLSDRHICMHAAYAEFINPQKVRESSVYGRLMNCRYISGYVCGNLCSRVAGQGAGTRGRLRDRGCCRLGAALGTSQGLPAPDLRPCPCPSAICTVQNQSSRATRPESRDCSTVFFCDTILDSVGINPNDGAGVHTYIVVVE